MSATQHYAELVLHTKCDSTSMQYRTVDTSEGVSYCSSNCIVEVGYDHSYALVVTIDQYDLSYYQ